MAGVAVAKAVSQHKDMAGVADFKYGMAEGNDTVWIGFMDIIPVIGSVKESVELVLAVYEGKTKVIKEKEKALEDFKKVPIRRHVRKTQTQYVPPAEFSGLPNVKEVPKGKIVEHVKKGSKNQNLSEKEKAARAKKLEKIRRDMVEKLQSIGRPFNNELQEEMKRSDRGEHVFNNDILKFHSKVLKNFINTYRIESLPGYNKATMDQLGTNTLSSTTQNDIQNVMVVHFDPDEFYVNANAILYGAFSEALCDAFLDVLGHINPGDETEQEKQNVTLIIDCMNNFEIYVDQFAKQKWIGNNQNREARFLEVRQEMAEMFRTDRGLSWCNDIMRVVAPLFNRRQ